MVLLNNIVVMLMSGIKENLCWEHLVYVKSKSEKRGKRKLNMTCSLFIVQKCEHEKQWQQSDLLRDADSFQMGFP